MSKTITGKVTMMSRARTGIKIDNGGWINTPKSDPDIIKDAGVEYKDYVTAEVDGRELVSISKKEQSNSSPSSSKKEVDWDARNAKIEMQSARRDAIQLVQWMVDKEVTPLAGAKEAHYGAILDLVEQVTEELYFMKIPTRTEDSE